MKSTPMNEQKLLLTGGTGFVGKHLREELERRGIEHYAFSKSQYDLTLRDQAEEVFAANDDAGVIVHLASYQAAADFPAKHTAEQFHVNNLIHVNVLEAWRKFVPKAKFIAIGSSCGYPSDAPALTEAKFLDGGIHDSVYSYAFTKRLLFTGITAYNDQYQLNGSYLIPPTMYGEYDDFHVETAHVCGALVGKFVKAVRENIPEVEIWGDGTQVRDFIYVKDFIDALLYLIPLCDRDIVNVGPGAGTSIKELSDAIKTSSGFKGTVSYNTNRYVGVGQKVLDITKLATKYNWKVEPGLSEGIQRTVDWFSGSYDLVKDKCKFS